MGMQVHFFMSTFNTCVIELSVIGTVGTLHMATEDLRSLNIIPEFFAISFFACNVSCPRF